MSSQELERARSYEEEREKRILAEDRPAFHLSARVGWMNDPNGFSRYKDQYHLFYQYHPYDSHWGPMHWGHAVSKDLLHWEYLPAAIAPDMPYDREGCFSGGAMELADGRQMLMYTGVSREIGENGDPCDVQTQCVAFGDGVDYEKYSGNPVLTIEDLPEGADKTEFRDPRIWQEEDGTFCAAVVNYSKLQHKVPVHDRLSDNSDGLLASTRIHEEEEGGQILLFKSPDGLHWRFDRKIAVNGYRIGRMWECPDLFSLDGKDVILASAMDMLPQGLEYHNGNGAFCLIGHKDPATGDFIPEHDQAVDYGIDFYAEQTVLAPDGRRIMIAWMQNWDTCSLHTKSIPWFGQMTIPRELSVRDGRLFQRPIRELEAYRTDRVEYSDVLVRNEEIELEGIRGRLVDLELELNMNPLEDTGDLPGKLKRFSLRMAKDDRFHTSLSFRPLESTLKVDRKFSGSRRAIIHQRRARIRFPKGKLRLRVILDRFSVEVFINDGEQVMTATIFTDIRADRIAFFADGEVRLNVTKYALQIEQ